MLLLAMENAVLIMKNPIWAFNFCRESRRVDSVFLVESIKHNQSEIGSFEALWANSLVDIINKMFQLFSSSLQKQPLLVIS